MAKTRTSRARTSEARSEQSAMQIDTRAAGTRKARQEARTEQLRSGVPDTAAGITTMTAEQHDAKRKARREGLARLRRHEVGRDEAQRDADTVAPVIGTAAPNPIPRPAVTSTRFAELDVPEGRGFAEFSGDRIKVQATKLGYYDDKRRRPGDVFWIHDEDAFSEKWMRPVAEDTPVRTTMMTEALRQQQREIKAMRRNEPSSERTAERQRDLDRQPASREAAQEAATGDENVLEA